MASNCAPHDPNRRFRRRSIALSDNGLHSSRSSRRLRKSQFEGLQRGSCSQCVHLRRRILYLESLLKPSITCNICGTHFVTTQGLSSHRYNKHKNKRYKDNKPATELTEGPSRDQAVLLSAEKTGTDVTFSSAVQRACTGRPQSNSFKESSAANITENRCAFSREKESPLVNRARTGCIQKTPPKSSNADLKMVPTSKNDAGDRHSSDVNTRMDTSFASGTRAQTFVSISKQGLRNVGEGDVDNTAITVCRLRDGKYHCAFCTESFFQEKHIWRHMSLVHEDGYYSCRYCAVHFDNTSDLSCHEKSCHVKRAQSSAAVSMDVTYEKPDDRTEAQDFTLPLIKQPCSKQVKSCSKNEKYIVIEDAPSTQHRGSSIQNFANCVQTSATNETLGMTAYADSDYKKNRICDASQGSIKAPSYNEKSYASISNEMRTQGSATDSLGKLNAAMSVTPQADEMEVNNPTPKTDKGIATNELKQKMKLPHPPYCQTYNKVCLNEANLSRSLQWSPNTKSGELSKNRKIIITALERNYAAAFQAKMIEHTLTSLRQKGTLRFSSRILSQGSNNTKAKKTNSEQRHSPLADVHSDLLEDDSLIFDEVIDLDEPVLEVEIGTAGLTELQSVQRTLGAEERPGTLDLELDREPHSNEVHLQEARREFDAKPSKPRAACASSLNHRDHSYHAVAKNGQTRSQTNASLQPQKEAKAQNPSAQTLVDSNLRPSTLDNHLGDMQLAQTVLDIIHANARPVEIKEEPLDEVVEDTPTTSSFDGATPSPANLIISVQNVAPMRMLVLGNGSLARVSAALRIFLESTSQRRPGVPPLEVLRAFVEGGDLQKALVHAIQWLRSSSMGPRAILMMFSLDVVDHWRGSQLHILILDSILTLLQECRTCEAELILCSLPAAPPSASPGLKMACQSVNLTLQSMALRFNLVYAHVDSPA